MSKINDGVQDAGQNAPSKVYWVALISPDDNGRVLFAAEEVVDGNAFPKADMDTEGKSADGIDDVDAEGLTLERLTLGGGMTGGTIGSGREEMKVDGCWDARPMLNLTLRSIAPACL
jgi:hypothetical protein